MTTAERHRAILDSLHETYKAKNADYGDSFHRSFARHGIIAPLVRMEDKLARLETLSRQEARVKDESMRDTLLDLANYAIMTAMEMDHIGKSSTCRCGGESHLQYGTVDHEVHGMTIHVHNVPHYVCKSCGRITYDIKTNVFDVLKKAAASGMASNLMR